jgi:glucose/arabinose dehydrogenase
LICLTDFDAQCDPWRETCVLLAGIPGRRLYNGGAIAIAPDVHLYLTPGWTGDRERPQDRASLAGKVLRMTLGVITHAAILH